MTRHRADGSLGVFYVLDQMRMYRAMTAASGQVRFSRNWYAGTCPADVMMPAGLAAKIVADVMRVEADGAAAQRPQLDLCVSHDMTLYLVRDRLLGLGAGDYGEVRFLDGVAVVRARRNGSGCAACEGCACGRTGDLRRDRRRQRWADEYGAGRTME